MSEMTAEGIRDLVGTSPTILEIGCNDGTDTNRFLEAMPDATIYCFEPDPRAVARFKETVLGFNLVEAAIADFDGFAVFHGSSGQPPEKSKSSESSHYCLLDEWDLSGSLCKPTGHLTMSPWVTFPEDRKIQVQVLKLDTWLTCNPQVRHIDFIWCDVQGAEALVIHGASRVLAITDYFYTEYYDKPMYKGQLSLSSLQELLPRFGLSVDYQSDALFRNKLNYQKR